MEEFTDTKTRIFDAALRLFASKGYDNVSVRDIANSVGIKAASIYNHYSCKNQILESCYNFYAENCHISRLTKEEYEPIIRNGTKEEVVEILNYTFPEDIFHRMILSLLTIYSRIFCDSKALDIYTYEIKDSMQYLIEFMNFGISVGRFKEFNVSTISLIILSSRLFTGYSTAIKPEEKSHWREAEVGAFNEFIKIIPFNY